MSFKSDRSDVVLRATSLSDDMDAYFMPEVMIPISHANDQYTLINVLKNFNNGELE